MQLTKDDVKTGSKIFQEIADNDANIGDEISKQKHLDFSKFQQVVEFYEKYKNDNVGLENDYPETYKLFPFLYSHDEDDYKDWLFKYCFVEGLK